MVALTELLKLQKSDQFPDEPHSVEKAAIEFILEFIAIARKYDAFF